MNSFLNRIGMFAARTLIIVLAILLVVGTGLYLTKKAAFSIINKGRRTSRIKTEEIEVKYLNDKYLSMEKTLNKNILDDDAFEAWEKKQKENEKLKGTRQRVFVLDFSDDVDAMREEITAILAVATPKDEVIIRLESYGGWVTRFGLGAAQLQRVKNKQIPLTVVVDEAALSGGYAVACVADKVYCAPFALIGSIGVVSEIMNYNRVLEKYGIDYELFTAGEHKRLVTTFGETTEESRQKVREKLAETHRLFKDLVSTHRRLVDINSVDTGEGWYGTHALALNLVDKLITSDEVLLSRVKVADVYHVSYSEINSGPMNSLENRIISAILRLIRRILNMLMSVDNPLEAVPD